MRTVSVAPARLPGDAETTATRSPLLREPAVARGLHRVAEPVVDRRPATRPAGARPTRGDRRPRTSGCSEIPAIGTAGRNAATRRAVVPLCVGQTIAATPRSSAACTAACATAHATRSSSSAAAAPCGVGARAAASPRPLRRPRSSCARCRSGRRRPRSPPTASARRCRRAPRWRRRSPRRASAAASGSSTRASASR